MAPKFVAQARWASWRRRCGRRPWNNLSWKHPVMFKRHHLIFGSGNVVSLPPACNKPLTAPRCCGIPPSSWCGLAGVETSGCHWLLSLLASPCGSALTSWGWGWERGSGSCELRLYKGHCSWRALQRGPGSRQNEKNCASSSVWWKALLTQLKHFPENPTVFSLEPILLAAWWLDKGSP